MAEMSEAEVLAEFRAAGALLQGHFVLTSGLHSPFYLQCARVLMDPARAARLVAALAAAPRRRSAPTWSWPPALGGIVLGYEVGRQLGLPARSSSSGWRAASRCGAASTSPAGSRIVVAEDVVTTGPLDPRMHRLLPGAGRRGRRPPPASSTAAAARPISACRWSASPASTCRPTRSTSCRPSSRRSRGQAGLARAGCATRRAASRAKCRLDHARKYL